MLLDDDDSPARIVVDHLVVDDDDSDDEGRQNGAKYSGSFQRLAKYMSKPKDKENLRSHTDWTLATLVPVSPVPGLQVYHGDYWVQPEAQR